MICLVFQLSGFGKWCREILRTSYTTRKFVIPNKYVRLEWYYQPVSDEYNFSKKKSCQDLSRHTHPWILDGSPMKPSFVIHRWNFFWRIRVLGKFSMTMVHQEILSTTIFLAESSNDDDPRPMVIIKWPWPAKNIFYDLAFIRKFADERIFKIKSFLSFVKFNI